MNSPVLLYHKIDVPTPDVKIRGAFTAPARFEKQVKYLKTKGFAFATASDLVDGYMKYGRFPDRTVCISFDDGWKDNYLFAFPILKKYGATATIFLVPECVGKTTDRVTADGEGPREHLSIEDIHEMAAYGIEFGSHSFSHRLLHKASPADVEHEVTASKAYIEELLQRECTTFAFPAGFFSDTAKEKVRAAGYKAAFSTVYGTGTDIFELNRIEILRRDGYLFRFGRKVHGIS